MVRIKYALAGAALAALVVPSLGAADEGIKMGVVDLEQALSSTEEGKAAREEMGRKQREAESTVQPLVDRFNTMKEEIKSKKFVLSDESLFQKQLDLAELQNQIQTKLKELEGQLKVLSSRKFRDWEGALAAVNELLVMMPNDADVLETQGDILDRLGRYAEAREAYKAARKEKPRSKELFKKYLKAIRKAKNAEG